jgi:hypothetical protein
MAMGMPVGRQWVFILNNGDVVIDWGDNTFQDVYTGEFYTSKEKEFSRHLIQDSQLDHLKRIGIVVGYDNDTVYFSSLPELPKH